jgi:hypothetical protein
MAAGAEDSTLREMSTVIAPYSRRNNLNADDTQSINPGLVGKSRRTVRDIQLIFNRTILANYKTWIKSLELIKKLSSLCHTINNIAATIALQNVQNMINMRQRLSASDKLWLKTQFGSVDGFNDSFPIADDIINYSIWLDRYYAPWLTSYCFAKLTAHLKGFGELLDNVANILGRFSRATSNILIMKRDVKVKFGTLSNNSHKYSAAVKRQIQYMGNDPSPDGLELLNSLKPRSVPSLRDQEWKLEQFTLQRMGAAVGGQLRFIDTPMFDLICAEWASNDEYPRTSLELVTWILKLPIMRAYSLATTIPPHADEDALDEDSFLFNLIQSKSELLKTWITEGPYALYLFFANDSFIVNPTFTSIISTGQVRILAYSQVYASY